MPAQSEAQRRAASMALAAKHGKLGQKARGAVKSMMRMSDESLREFATKKKGNG